MTTVQLREPGGGGTSIKVSLKSKLQSKTVEVGDGVVLFIPKINARVYAIVAGFGGKPSSSHVGTLTSIMRRVK